MDVLYDGIEVIVVMEEIEEVYCYIFFGLFKKKKKYKIYGEKIKKFRFVYFLYYYDIYLKVQQEFFYFFQFEINKKISESWRFFSVVERSYYLEKVKLEKEGLDFNFKFFVLIVVVLDILGFCKIFLCLDYIIIFKSSLQEDWSCFQLELCVVQNQMFLKGFFFVFNIVLEIVFSYVGMVEQCLVVEVLVEEVGVFIQLGVVQEIVILEIFSQDVFLEDVFLEVGESY